jgi:hypothetical protein
MASASGVERLRSGTSDKRLRRLPPRRLAYQATPCRQIDSVPGMPSPSISTAAVGTAPVKSLVHVASPCRSARHRHPYAPAATLADQGVNVDNHRRARGVHICHCARSCRESRPSHHDVSVGVPGDFSVRTYRRVYGSFIGGDVPRSRPMARTEIDRAGLTHPSPEQT